MLYELKTETPYLCHHNNYQFGDTRAAVGMMTYNEFVLSWIISLVPSTNRIEVACSPAFPLHILAFDFICSGLREASFEPSGVCYLLTLDLLSSYFNL